MMISLKKIAFVKKIISEICNNRKECLQNHGICKKNSVQFRCFVVKVSGTL